jgi:ABC-type Fe3+ transport system substrate-binding protein
MPASVLITGANGFIGSHVTNLMESLGHKVVPIDPMIATTGTSGMVVKALNLHAALLFLDFLHSKEAQQVVMKGGLSSARNDFGLLTQKFKKVYIESKYPPEELEKKFDELNGLKRRLVISKR